MPGRIAPKSILDEPPCGYCIKANYFDEAWKTNKCNNTTNVALPEPGFCLEPGADFSNFDLLQSKCFRC